MDGILALEGSGRRGGNPKAMNILLFSLDPIALDSTVCRLMKIDPSLVPTITLGYETGQGEYKDDEIEWVGDSLETFIPDTFEVDPFPVKPLKGTRLLNFFSGILLPRPVIKKDRCVECGICIKFCPVNPKALSWKKKGKKRIPTYHYGKCIRCYCCQEICPQKAIGIRQPIIRKGLARIFKKGGKNDHKN